MEPGKANDQKVKTGLPKTISVFDKVKEDMLMEVVEGVLPKIKPFLTPALEKFNEWFGEDEKLIVIRKNKGQSAKVIIFDNLKGEYQIKKSADNESNIFTADKESIIAIHDIEDFMAKLLSGDITKMMD